MTEAALCTGESSNTVWVNETRRTEGQTGRMDRREVEYARGFKTKTRQQLQKKVLMPSLQRLWEDGIAGNMQEHKAKARAIKRSSFSSFGWRQSSFCLPSPSLNTVHRTCL
jgi:hypothetical protein